MPDNLSPPQVTHLFGLPVDFKRLADELPIGVVILDAQRRIVFINQAVEALTGFTRRQAAGIPCRFILRNGICPERCPVPGLDGDSDPVSRDTDLINCDRQRLPIRITLAPIVGLDGQLAGHMETIEDLRPLQGLAESTGHAYSFGTIIGKSREMEKIFEILPSVAQSDSSVLITGETGTGKDLVAEAIHQASGRAKGPFIKINCGALPETLLESEIFGHRKGAFTGAVEDKPGRFRLAHNGTLFLTEVGDLPLSLQVKLLTFLDDKVVYPLGSTKAVAADVRIIAATHQHLEKMVQEGRFRQDLLFRLNVVRVHLPPVRRRGEDIRLLLDHFLNFFAAQMHKTIEGFSDNALSLLTGYGYPGNIRELRNIVEYAVNVCTGSRINARHLPAYLTDPAQAVGFQLPVDGHRPDAPDDTQDRLVQPAPGATWDQVERDMIMEAMVKAGGRKIEAARILGWARTTLWRKMKRYGISA